MAIEYADDEQQQTPQQPKKTAATGYQWNTGNVFNNWDLNPLAQEIGGGAEGVRDELSDSRNAFLQPKMAEYRNAMGVGNGGAAADDQTLFNDQQFRSYVQTGQMPVNPNAPPAQQWSASSSSTGTNPALQDRQNQLFDLLMQRIQQPITPDADDPTIRRQADAYSANQTRASRDYLADLAERGGPYMNMTGEARLAAERAGQNSAGFEAELIGREQDARRDSIQKDLGLYGSLLGDEDQLDLSLQMAQMDDRYKREALGWSKDQFLREMAQRQYEYDDDSAYRWMTGGY